MLSYVHRRCYGEPTEPADRPILEDDDTASWWSIRGFTARKYTEIVDRVLAKATPAIGEYLFSYLSEDPDPESAVVLNWRETWPDIEADLKAKLRTKLGVAESDMLAKVRALRLRGWVEAPPSPHRAAHLVGCERGCCIAASRRKRTRTPTLRLCCSS